MLDAHERTPWLVIFGAVGMTSAGSAWFHLGPSVDSPSRLLYTSRTLHEWSRYKAPQAPDLDSWRRKRRCGSTQPGAAIRPARRRRPPPTTALPPGWRA